MKNTFFGHLSNSAATSLQYNTGLGAESLLSLNTGEKNTAIGYQALVNATSAGSNTGVGLASLSGLTTGFVNTAIGRESLSLTTGNRNIGIGFQAEVPSPSGSNQIAIGTASETMYIQGGFNYKVGTPITGAITLTGVLSQFYTLTSAAPYTITIPAAGSTYTGAVINFRRVSGSAQIQFLSASGTAIVPYNAPTASGPVFLTTTQMSTTFICDGITWYQMQTV